MSSIYEKRVTKHWIEFSIKVRSLSIGELQLLTKWLIDNVGDERAEFANAVTFEVRGDDDDADLVAVIADRAARPASGVTVELMSMQDVLTLARTYGGMAVSRQNYAVMLNRMVAALHANVAPPLPFEHIDQAHLFGVQVWTHPDVSPDCIRIGSRDYLLTEGSRDAIVLPGCLVAPGTPQSPAPGAPVVQPATGSDET